MRNRIVGAVVVVTSSLGIWAAGPVVASSMDWREAEIRYARSDGRPGWSTDDVVRAIRAAVKRWPVEGGLAQALAVARCESGDDLLAPAEPGGYSGTYQQAERYWAGRRATFNPPAWDKPLPLSSGNPRANVVVSIRMAHATGWSVHWAACD